MKAVVYSAPRQFDVRTVPTPEPGAGEVRLSVEMAGMCGTDLHIHDGGFFSKYPLTPGHEIVGHVDCVGVGAEGLPVGRRGCRRQHRALWPLPVLSARRAPVLQQLLLAGGQRAGSVRRVRHCACREVLPRGRPESEHRGDDRADCVRDHGMDVLDLRPGSDVLLFGAGPTGLVLAQLLVHGGAARVTVAAPRPSSSPWPRVRGRQDPADRPGGSGGFARGAARRCTCRTYDVVIEATGASSVGELCLPLVRDGGTILIYGMADEGAVLPIHPYEIFRRELTVKGSFAQTHCFDRALAVLRSGRVRTEGMVTHAVPPRDYQSALEALRDDILHEGGDRPLSDRGTCAGAWVDGEPSCSWCNCLRSVPVRVAVTGAPESRVVWG